MQPTRSEKLPQIVRQFNCPTTLDTARSDPRLPAPQRKPEMTSADVTPIRPGHEFDVDRLAYYLASHLEGVSGTLTARQFRGGQSNPTFLVETGDRRFVLRKKPPGRLLPSAHMIEREYRVMHALRDSNVPMIATHLLCEDASVIGTPFYLMDFAEGRIFRDPSLPGLAPNERRDVYAAMGEVMARLHMVDWRAVGLENFGKAAGYLGRQISLWTRQYEAAKHRHSGHGRTDRLASRRHAGRRHDDDRARRLPSRKSHVPSDRTARDRRA